MLSSKQSIAPEPMRAVKILLLTRLLSIFKQKSNKSEKGLPSLALIILVTNDSPIPLIAPKP